MVYIILKHMITNINLFGEKFKFCNFKNLSFYEFREIYHCSYFGDIWIFRETKYIFWFSRSHASEWYTTGLKFKSLEFFSTSKNGLHLIILQKSQNQNILSIPKMNQTLCSLFRINGMIHRSILRWFKTDEIVRFCEKQEIIQIWLTFTFSMTNTSNYQISTWSVDQILPSEAQEIMAKFIFPLLTIWWHHQILSITVI